MLRSAEHQTAHFACDWQQFRNVAFTIGKQGQRIPPLRHDLDERRRPFHRPIEIKDPAVGLFTSWSPARSKANLSGTIRYDSEHFLNHFVFKQLRR